MTNEEAIYELSVNVDYKTPQIKESCQMAIRSLEAWEKVKEEIEAESKKNYTNSVFNKGLYRAIEIIDKYISEVRGDTDGKE